MELSIWSAFIGFDKSLKVIMPEGKRHAIHFIHNIYEGTFNGFYFMHGQCDEFKLMENGDSIHWGEFSEK